MTKANLLWIDLEMTGLDPLEDKIVEVAAIATDFDFNKIETYQASVRTDPEFMSNRMTGEFWDKNDASRQSLIKQSSSAEAKTLAEIEDDLLEVIKEKFDNEAPIYLAGNSVHQDRKFMSLAWPTLDEKLSYRMLDVSAWKIVFENRGVKFTKPELHRALDDIQGSIDELKYYLKRVKFWWIVWARNKLRTWF